MKQVFALAVLSLVAATAFPSPASADPLPYGPETCRAGYVWREASPADRVCVTPEARSRTAAENAAAPTRIQPGGGAYGPNTCMAGFVWREAFPGDVVCVTPEIRELVRQENILGPSRRVAP